MSLLTTHDTAQPSPGAQCRLGTQFPQNSSPAAFIRWLPEPEPWEQNNQHQARPSNSQQTLGAGAVIEFDIRPSVERKNCPKVCREFQEAVIGSVARTQGARHWHWPGVRILNIATKFSPELRTSDQVSAHVTNERFSWRKLEFCQELRNPVPVRLRRNTVLHPLLCWFLQGACST